MINLKVTDEFGRGLYASELIKANSIIMQCEILVLSTTDTPIVNSTDLQWYTFVYNDKQDCLVLGLGEIFNHSDTANVSYNLIDYNGRKVMQFLALQDIQIDTQLFINYSKDSKIEADKYTVNLM